MISTPVLLAVLGSALLHAGWNFLVKASGERLLDTATLALGGSLLAAFLLPWVSLPASASLPWLAISVLIHVAYFVALIETYRHADLSVAYPLMRGLAPVLVALVSPLCGEVIAKNLPAVANHSLIGITAVMRKQEFS